MLIQCNIIQKLAATTSFSQWHYGHAVIVTVAWGLIPLADQVLKDQPTMPKVPFGGVCQQKNIADLFLKCLPKLKLQQP